MKERHYYKLPHVTSISNTFLVLGYHFLTGTVVGLYKLLLVVSF